MQYYFFIYLLCSVTKRPKPYKITRRFLCRARLVHKCVIIDFRIADHTKNVLMLWLYFFSDILHKTFRAIDVYEPLHTY